MERIIGDNPDWAQKSNAELAPTWIFTHLIALHSYKIINVSQILMFLRKTENYTYTLNS